MSISDILVAITLLINAGAVLNFKLGPRSEEFEFEDSEPSWKEKIKDFLRNLRYFRVFIAMWNVIVLIAMVLLFSG
eukprot:m.325798 g.325798  ORF g.325798 m.325798 type:complete len:76 (+) comp16015_c0_seq22:178-405(+)